MGKPMGGPVEESIGGPLGSMGGPVGSLGEVGRGSMGSRWKTL